MILMVAKWQIYKEGNRRHGVVSSPWGLLVFQFYARHLLQQLRYQENQEIQTFAISVNKFSDARNPSSVAKLALIILSMTYSTSLQRLHDKLCQLCPHDFFTSYIYCTLFKSICMTEIKAINKNQSWKSKKKLRKSLMSRLHISRNEQLSVTT